MIILLEKMIREMLIAYENMLLRFKIITIEERQPFMPKIFLFRQLEDGPFLSSRVVS